MGRCLRMRMHLTAITSILPLRPWRTAKGAPARFLSRLFASEIDHRNIVNILEASAVGIPSDQLVSLLIPGGRLLPKRSFSTIASGGRGAMLDLLRAGDRFDMSAFEVVLNESEINSKS